MNWGCKCSGNKGCGSAGCHCGSHCFGHAAKWCTGLAAGFVGGLLKHCKTGCKTCQTDIVVHAIPGEVRIVPYVIKNDTSCPIEVKPKVGPWQVCGCEGQEKAGALSLQPGDPFTIEPCGSASFDIVLATKGLKACTCYCATITLEGASCEKIDVMFCIGGKVPAVCHHTPTKLLSWIKQCCFGAGKYYAPPAHAGCGCGSCCK